jgi:ERF superfamily.
VKTSETLNELAAALAAAQGEMSNAAFNADNPAFKSGTSGTGYIRYANLAAIRDATIPHLSKHGLALLQTTDVNTTEMLLTTRLLHSSGQWVESIYPIPVSDRPHVMGSALTYAKRYSWAAICGVASDKDDDDGNAAQDAAKNGGSGHPALLTKRTRAEISADANRKRQEYRDVEQDLLQIDSLAALDRYSREVLTPEFMAALGMKQWAVEQKVGERRRELEDWRKAEEKEPSEGSPEDAHVRDELIEALQKMDTEAKLLVWKESPAFRRDLASLPKAMQLAVRKAGATKLETLQKAAR